MLAIQTYSWLKSVHVLAAVMWVGGSVMLTLLGIMTIGLRDPVRLTQFAKQVAFLGGRYFPPLSLMVVGFGFWMVQENDLGYGATWLKIGIAGWIASFVIGAGYLGPRASKLAKLLDRAAARGRRGPGSDHAHPPRRANRRRAPALPRVRHDREAGVVAR